MDSKAFSEALKSLTKAIENNNTESKIAASKNDVVRHEKVR